MGLLNSELKLKNERRIRLAVAFNYIDENGIIVSLAMQKVLPKTIKDDIKNIRNWLSHLVHKDQALNEFTQEKIKQCWRIVLSKITQNIENFANKDFVKNGNMCEQNLVFIACLLLPKSQARVLIDGFEDLKDDKDIFTKLSHRDSYNSSRDIIEENAWTTFCQIVDYVRKPLPDSSNANQPISKNPKDPINDIRTKNPYMFDVLFFKWFKNCGRQPVTGYEIEFAKSIAVECEKNRKWIKRPYFEDSEGQADALQALNNNRLFIANEVQNSSVRKQTNKLEFNDLEYYRDSGKCYIIRFCGNCYRLHRDSLMSLFKMIMDSQRNDNNYKLSYLKTILEQVNINKPKKTNDNKDKQDFLNHHKSCFNTQKIVSKSAGEIIHFLLWCYQHYLGDTTVSHLTRDEYQDLFEQALSEYISIPNKANIPMVIRQFGDKRMACYSTIKQLCNKIQKDIGNLNNPSIAETEKQEIANKLKIRYNKQPKGEARAIYKHYMQGMSQNIVCKKEMENKHTKYDILEKQKELPNLSWKNYSNIDVDLKNVKQSLKNKNRHDKNKAYDAIRQYKQDILLLDMARDCLREYKKKTDEKSFHIEFNEKQNLQNLTFTIVGLQDYPLSIAHLGKNYFQIESSRIIEIAKNIDNVKNDNHIIAKFKQEYQKARRGWYDVGKKIFDIEENIINKKQLTIPDNKDYISFKCIIESIEPSCYKNMNNIRKSCMHIHTFEKWQGMKREDAIKYIDELCEKIGLLTLSTDIENNKQRRQAYRRINNKKS